MRFNRFIIVPFLVLAAACGETKDEPTPTPPPPPTPPTPVVEENISNGWIMDDPEYVFGFTAQSRYSYCPCPILNSDGTVDIWFCGNPTQTIFIDNIYHITLGTDGRRTGNPVSVLQPGPVGAWDDHHVCDPSIVEGCFTMDGVQYRYAMFYLGCNLKTYYNEIGVAFANDLQAKEWVKYPSQIVPKTWDYEGDQLIGNFKAWGVGQPSVLSLDKAGKVLLSYTVGDRDGTCVVCRTVDLTDVNNFTLTPAVPLSRVCLTAINGRDGDYLSDIEAALDPVTETVVMVRPVHPCPTTYPAFIEAEVELDAISLREYCNGVGAWEPMRRVRPSDSGYPRNHNPGLLRDSYGHITDTQSVEVYYTISKEEPDVSLTPGHYAEWSYAIYRALIHKKPQ